MAHTLEEIAAVRDKHNAWIMEQTGVTGTALSIDEKGDAFLRIYSNQIPDEVKAAIMKRFQGIPTAFHETGRIRAQ